MKYRFYLKKENVHLKREYWLLELCYPATDEWIHIAASNDFAIGKILMGLVGIKEFKSWFPSGTAYEFEADSRKEALERIFVDLL